MEAENPYLDDLVAGTPPDEVLHSAVTLGRDRGFVGGLEARGARAWALGCPTRRQYPRALARLLSLIRRERPHIVHTHLFDPTIMGMALARLTRTRRVMTRHFSDQIHRLPPLKRRGYLALQGWANRAADHIIAPSRQVFEVLTGMEKVPASKVSVIPYGQTLDRYRAVTPEVTSRLRAELGLEDGYALVMVGRLHADKGHRYLFEAFARFLGVEPRARLVVVGDGPRERELKDLVIAMGLAERVRFAGFRADAVALLGAADLVVHPSLSEALSIVVIEALSLGKAVVATEVGGMRDLLGDGEHGWMVPMADAEALFDAMCEARAHPEQARARAERGRRHVSEMLDSRRVAEAYVRCYRRLLSD
jgi:glycosyltransferase involved in cell wall biosynthesis